MRMFLKHFGPVFIPKEPLVRVHHC